MCSSNTCDMYMCCLRHVNDLVLSSLKMEGIRLRFDFPRGQGQSKPTLLLTLKDKLSKALEMESVSVGALLLGNMERRYFPRLFFFFFFFVGTEQGLCNRDALRSVGLLCIA
jgi:hypothetical protein